MGKRPGRPIRAYAASQLEAMGCGAKSWIIRQCKKHNIDSVKGIIEGNEANLYVFRCLPPEWKSKVTIYEEQQKQAAKLIAIRKEHQKELQAISELPLDTQEDREFLWNELAKRTNQQRDKGLQRLKAVQAFEDRRHGQGMTERDAVTATALEFEQHPNTIRGWIRKSRTVGRVDRITVLASQHVGCLVEAEFTPDAWAAFKKDWLRKVSSGKPPTIAACYRRLEAIARLNGWTIPGKRTVENWIKRHLDPMVIKYRREGMEAVEKCFPAMERNKEMFNVLEAINGDGFEIGLWADFGNDIIAKPIVWSWQDIRSSKVLAWRMDVSENSELIRLATLDLITEWGVPSYIYLDNTRAATSKQISGGVPNRYRFKIKEHDPLGVIPLLGIELKYTKPASGRSKPVERIHGIGGYLDFAALPVFIGRGTKGRPIPIEEIEEHFRSFVNEINARPDRQGEAVKGKSFDQAFNELYPEAVITKATEKQRKYCMCMAEVVTVSAADASITLRAGKASFGHNRYWNEALTSYMGQKVTVRFDPADMHGGVFVETLQGAEICFAESTIRGGFKDAVAAKEVARAKGHFKKSVKEAADAEGRLTAAEARAQGFTVPDPEKPKTGKVSRMMTGRRSRPDEQQITINDDGPGIPPDMEKNYEKKIKEMAEARKYII